MGSGGTLLTSLTNSDQNPGTDIARPQLLFSLIHRRQPPDEVFCQFKKSSCPDNLIQSLVIRNGMAQAIVAFMGADRDVVPIIPLFKGEKGLRRTRQPPGPQ